MYKSSYRAAIVRFLKEEDGPTAVEYAVMLALIVLSLIGSVTLMVDETRKSFDKSADAISDPSTSPMFRKTKRIPPARQVLVTDSIVQGALLRRLALYGACGLFYFSIIEFLDVALANPDQSRMDIARGFLEQSIYWAPGLVVLMPIFAYDLLRLSNRFTGPVTRLRKEMRDLTVGAQLEPIEFRDEDFLKEMADEYNALRDEVIALREQVAKIPKSEGVASLRKGSLFGKKKVDSEQPDRSAEELLETASV